VERETNRATTKSSDLVLIGDPCWPRDGLDLEGWEKLSKKKTKGLGKKREDTKGKDETGKNVQCLSHSVFIYSRGSRGRSATSLKEDLMRSRRWRLENWLTLEPAGHHRSNE